MARFSRSGARPTRVRVDADASADAPVPRGELPEINARATIAVPGGVPFPTRVEDLAEGTIVLADAAVTASFGDTVTVTWERGGIAYSLRTHLIGRVVTNGVPTLQVAASGVLDHALVAAGARRVMERQLDLRAVNVRTAVPGRVVRTRTSELGEEGLAFASSDRYSPGDVFEARIVLADGSIVSARIRIRRVEATRDAWQRSYVAAFDEILRSDVVRIRAEIALEASRAAPAGGVHPIAPPPTSDGRPGRDEPEPLSTLDDVLGWIRRRRGSRSSS